MIKSLQKALLILMIAVNTGCTEKRETCIGEEKCDAYGVFSLEELKSGMLTDENLKKEGFYNILIVKPDGTFTVKMHINNDDKDKVGHWKFIEFINDEENPYSVIEFTSENETIIGKVSNSSYLYRFENNFNDGIVPNALYVHVLCSYLTQEHKWYQLCSDNGFLARIND